VEFNIPSRLSLLYIARYIANTVKRFVMNEGYDKEMIFDTNTRMLMRDMPQMREEVA
jgi:2-hydroxychromene-2-carboxylate isomerase